MRYDPKDRDRFLSAWNDLRFQLGEMMIDLLCLDFNSTATGYAWLDKLTLPYWRFRVWYEHRRFVKAIEDIDEWIDLLKDAEKELDVWDGAIELDNVGFDNDYDNPSPWGTESYLEPWTPEPPDYTRPRNERP